MFRALLFLALLPGAVWASTGPLVFAETRQQRTVVAGTSELVVPFSFTVRDQPVTIVSVQASCGCTVPDLDRRTYAPGESGVIHAKYHPGQRQGAQVVRLLVQTDRPEQAHVELLLEVQLEELVRVAPRIVFWARGEEPTPKAIDIQVRAADPLAIVQVESANDDFTVALETVEAGRHYRILVTPRSTEGPYRAVLRWAYDGDWHGAAPTAYALIR